LTVQAVDTTIKETYEDVRGLLQTASWEVMEEDQRDDVIAKVVLPRWGKVTKDGVVLKGTAWAKLLGTTEATIRNRVARLQAADQGKSASASGPQPNQRASIRSAKASIKKHPELAKGLLNDPDVKKATTQALVDQGDIKSLSRATAAVAKNRQVERNRSRVTSGGTRIRAVGDPNPAPIDAGVKAFLSAKALANALRELVTTWPQEWNSYTPAQRADADFIASEEETLDKLEIAIASIRGMLGGESLDAELESLLSGGAE
jgi:hypothetical protein